MIRVYFINTNIKKTYAIFKWLMILKKNNYYVRAIVYLLRSIFFSINNSP